MFTIRLPIALNMFYLHCQQSIEDEKQGHLLAWRPYVNPK